VGTIGVYLQASSGKVLDDSAQNVKLVGDSFMAHYKPAAGNSSLQLATLIISFCIGFQNAVAASQKHHPISRPKRAKSSDENSPMSLLNP